MHSFLIFTELLNLLFRSSWDQLVESLLELHYSLLIIQVRQETKIPFLAIKNKRRMKKIKECFLYFIEYKCVCVCDIIIYTKALGIVT